MRNRLLTLTAVGSLIFVAAMAILWIRSFTAKSDRVSFAAGNVWEIHLTSYRGGFTIYRDLQRPRYSQYGMIVAGRYAFLVMLGLVLPAWRWGRTSNHIREGFCASCGYDLRASPERCPECGMERRPETGIIDDRRARNLTWIVGAAALACLYIAVGFDRDHDITEDAASSALLLGLACMFMAASNWTRKQRARRSTRSPAK